LRVYNPPLDEGPPAEVDGWGIKAALESRNWPAFAGIPELMMIRFIAAFPGQNVWAVYGASRRLTVCSENARATHAWFDVGEEGRLQEIAAPIEGNGYACSQLLTDFCVWPNAHGVLYCLAQHPSHWRPVYRRFHVLTAEVGRGRVSEKDYYRRVSRDKELRRIAPLHLDLQYARFLGRMLTEGGRESLDPMTIEQQQAREARAARILQEMGETSIGTTSFAPPSPTD
jgi:hypothetical protein